MNTLGPRTRISPVAGSMRTSLYAAAGPMAPGLMRVAGTPVAAPHDSVMPQTSSIGTPSARYQRTSSGEIGAAPVTRKRARWMPIILRTLSSASQRAMRNLKRSRPPTGSSASTRSAMAVPTPIAHA